MWVQIYCRQRRLGNWRISTLAREKWLIQQFYAVFYNLFSALETVACSCNQMFCGDFELQDWRMNWASSWDYGTYHIGDQRRLRRDCADQSLRCSQTWSIEIAEGFDQKIRYLAPLDGCACAFEWCLRRTKSTIISWDGSIFVPAWIINSRIPSAL